jgi:prolyl oligopeptidase
MIATLGSGAQNIAYPQTATVPQTDTYHGTVVADPYRWLEDDNSPATKDWVAQQNKVTDAFLEAMPQRQSVRKLYTALYNFEQYGVPYQEGGRYFWTHNDGLQPQSVLFTARTLKEAPQVALDPNTLSKDGTVALGGVAPSRDGKLLAYGIAGAGSDWQSWKVRDLQTGQDLTDDIQWVKFSGAEWTADSQGFFYARYDAPKEGSALTGVNYFHKLYYHRIGTVQAQDVLVFDNPAEKEWGFTAKVSDDGQQLFVTVWKGTDHKNGMLTLALPGGAYWGGKPTPITISFDAEYSPVALHGQQLIVKTTLGAPKGKVIAIDLKHPAPDQWKTLVDEATDSMTSASGVGGKLLLSYLHDASTLVRIHAANGKVLREMVLPGVGTATGFAGRWQDKETFFSFSSFTTPEAIYQLDTATGKTSLFKQPATAFDSALFETQRVYVTSKDGTRFPVFIAHRKGLVLDGNNPTLLYSYGGFNISMTPSYAVTAATWMQMGGV